MTTDQDRLLIIDHGERLARIETKLDAVLEAKKRWATVLPAIVSALTSGVILAVFKLLAQ